MIVDKKSEYEEKMATAKKRYGFFGEIDRFGLVGTPDQCIKRVRENAKRGITKYTIFFSDYMNHDTIRFFAKEVMSAF